MAKVELLSPYGLERVRHFSQLDPLFVPLVPTDYPPDDDLQKRMPVPLFLQSGTHAIAVHSAFGDSRLIEVVEENTAVLGRSAISGIGLLLDSDRQPPVARYAKLRTDMAARGFSLDSTPGQCARTSWATVPSSPACPRPSTTASSSPRA